jgi:hypothetical protein
MKILSRLIAFFGRILKKSWSILFQRLVLPLAACRAFLSICVGIWPKRLSVGEASAQLRVTEHDAFHQRDADCDWKCDRETHDLNAESDKASDSGVAKPMTGISLHLSSCSCDFAGTSTRPVSRRSGVSQRKCVSRGSSGSADVLSEAHEVLLAPLASMPE